MMLPKIRLTDLCGTRTSFFVVLMFLLTLSSVNVHAQLTNAGFEGPYQPVNSSSKKITGFIANGWTDNSAWGDVTVDYQQDTSGPHGGTSCQKVAIKAIKNGGFQMLETLPMTTGHLYTPGVWLRGVPGTRVNLWFALSGPPYTILEDVPAYLTNTWQFVSVPTHATQTTSVSFMVEADKPTTFYVDDASLADVISPVTPQITTAPQLPAFGAHIGNYLASKGPFNLNLESAFRPVGSSEATITGQIGQYWFDNSDWASLTANYSANTTTPHSGKSAQRVTLSKINTGNIQTTQFASLRLGQTYTASIWMRGTPGMHIGFGLRKWEIPYTVYAGQDLFATGAWQQLTVTGTVTDSGVSSIMVWAFSTGTLDFDDVVLLGSDGKVPDLGLPWPTTPIGTWRLWDQTGTTWASLEPTKGIWDFSLLDMAVQDALKNHTQIILTLGQSPTWASARPTEPSFYGVGAPAEPKDVNDWVNYLQTVATRYRGKIFNYEIWNEPNDPTYYSGSIPKLVQLTQLARQTLKQVDSRNQILSPAPYSVGYLQEFLAAGGAQYLDVVGYHIYDFTAPPEEDIQVLADLRTVKQNAGLASKPLWITEGAAGNTTTTDETVAAGLLARKYLVEMLYGSRRFNWYVWGSATFFCLGTTEADGITLTKAGAALGYLEGWMVGARIQKSTIDGLGSWVVQLQTPGKAAAYIVWNPAGAQNWNVPAGFKPQKLQDLFGNSNSVVGATKIPVTPQPVLVIGQ